MYYKNDTRTRPIFFITKWMYGDKFLDIQNILLEAYSIYYQAMPMPHNTLYLNDKNYEYLVIVMQHMIVSKQQNFKTILFSDWEGVNCDINKNSCTENSCENGATCVDEVNGFHCECRPNYIGEFIFENNVKQKPPGSTLD